MAYEAKILADSLSPDETRLTTLEVTFPRFVLAEFNTHRVFSRNSASSRAIPTSKRLKAVIDDPVLPLEWGANKAGMQASETLGASDALTAKEAWLYVRDAAALGALAMTGGLDNIKDAELLEYLIDLQNEVYPESGAELLPTRGSVHKQVVNRLLEPFMWHTVIVSSTEWDNFYALRNHPDAQPEIRHTAQLMQAAMNESQPAKLDYDQWHLPFILEEERVVFPSLALAKFAVARCARVSYETHDTGKIDRQRDIELHNSLAASGHMSPFEHVARPMTAVELAKSQWSGNFRGWHQYRKDIPNEDNYANVTGETN